MDRCTYNRKIKGCVPDRGEEKYCHRLPFSLQRGYFCSNFKTYCYNGMSSMRFLSFIPLCDELLRYLQKICDEKVVEHTYFRTILRGN